jgi:hypothetical protein
VPTDRRYSFETQEPTRFCKDGAGVHEGDADRAGKTRRTEMRTRLIAAAAAALGIALPAAGVAAGFATKKVSATLNGAAEVPKGSPKGSGTAVVKLNATTRKACWTIKVKGIDKPLSAHVHKAPPGKTGPVVIPLGARFAKTGCVTVPKPKKTKANPHPVDVLVAVAKHPRAYYVNVHTNKYLDGAIRGQLHAG